MQNSLANSLVDKARIEGGGHPIPFPVSDMRENEQRKHYELLWFDLSFEKMLFLPTQN